MAWWLCPPGREAEFLAPFVVEVIPGVGKKTAQHLHDMGVRSVRDLARLSLQRLRDEFGAHGESLYRLARGQDDSPVVTSHETKSISQERTFDRDTTDAAQIRRCLLDCAQGVGSELRRHGLMARTMTLKLRFEDFETLTRGLTLLAAHRPGRCDLRYSELRCSIVSGRAGARYGWSACGQATWCTRWPTSCSSSSREQEKQARVARAVDEIRARFGDDAIQRASLVERRSRAQADRPAKPEGMCHILTGRAVWGIVRPCQISLDSPIATGRTAEIYAWQDGTVLKLYYEWCPRRWLDEELRIARLVHAAGLAVPAPGEIVEINGRVGLVYERVDGPSMLDDMKQRMFVTLWRSARADGRAARGDAMTAPCPACARSRRVWPAPFVRRRGCPMTCVPPVLAAAGEPARRRSSLPRRLSPGQHPDDQAWADRH